MPHLSDRLAGRFPGWLRDLLLAVVALALGVAIERATEGRLFTGTIVLWLGLGSFLLLRVGAALAARGRTLGCGFVFAITWVLPCAALLYMMANPSLQRVVRDSPTFFLYLGFVLIGIMVVTFERLRIADEKRSRKTGT